MRAFQGSDSCRQHLTTLCILSHCVRLPVVRLLALHHYRTVRYLVVGVRSCQCRPNQPCSLQQLNPYLTASRWLDIASRTTLQSSGSYANRGEQNNRHMLETQRVFWDNSSAQACPATSCKLHWFCHQRQQSDCQNQ